MSTEFFYATNESLSTYIKKLMVYYTVPTWTKNINKIKIKIKKIQIQLLKCRWWMNEELPLSSAAAFPKGKKLKEKDKKGDGIWKGAVI